MNGWVLPPLAETSLGNALLFGFIVCLVAFLCAWLLCKIDKWADSYSSEDRLNEEDKFNFRDITRFDAQFWLLALTNLFVYGSVFPYIQNVSENLITKYNFSDREAAVLFGVPYIIAVVICPIFGIISDKIGKRVKFIITSLSILIFGFFLSAVIPGCPPDKEKCYYELAPLFFIGIGYAIYLAVFYGSIPLTVEYTTVGTAFGIV